MDVIIKAGLEFGLSPAASVSAYALIMLSAAAFVYGLTQLVARVLNKL